MELRQMVWEFTTDRISDSLPKDEEYKKVRKDYSKLFQEIMEMNPKLKKKLFRLDELEGEIKSYEGHALYKQGFKDAFNLFLELTN